MDVGAESAGTGVAPTPAPPAAQTALAVSSAEAAGGSKFGADAVVLDLGKVLPLPAGQERKEGALDDAAARGEGECASVVVDIKGEGAKGLGDGDGVNWDSEKMCRICHVSPERREVSEGSELIQLGCGCKNELGVAHRHCAEAWFKLKGNRCCEICGVPAKNITGIEDANFLEEWNDRTVSNGDNGNAGEGGRCWRGQPLCNFLMACLVIAFILPWFFRVNMF
uniref:E3 ubiquitin-protein ligase MARCH1 n=2 Tax=Anthurium amnicola TaxID=1678845 RepID=A0A1D1ZD58_9ARAE